MFLSYINFMSHEHTLIMFHGRESLGQAIKEVMLDHVYHLIHPLINMTGNPVNNLFTSKND